MKKTGLTMILSAALIAVSLYGLSRSEGGLFKIALAASIALFFAGLFLNRNLIHVKSRSTRNGPEATGRLASVHYDRSRGSTAVSVRFRTPDGRRVAADDSLHIPNHDKRRDAFRTGCFVHLRYNPDNPCRIYIDKEATLAAISRFEKQTEGEDLLLDRLAGHVKAEGIVLSSVPLGKTVNGNSLTELQIRVSRPEGGAFEVATVKAVSQAGMGSTAPGSVVTVYYEYGNENEIRLATPSGILAFHEPLNDGDLQVIGRIANYIADDFLFWSDTDLRKDERTNKTLMQLAQQAKTDLELKPVALIKWPYASAGPDGPNHLKILLSRAQLAELNLKFNIYMNAPELQ